MGRCQNVNGRYVWCGAFDCAQGQHLPGDRDKQRGRVGQRVHAFELSVLDAATVQIVDSIPLSPVGGLAVSVGGDGLLYVIAKGPASGSQGRLAIVDPATRTEVAVINGLGDPTGAVVQHPSGRLLVPSLQGILEVDPARRSVTRGPGNGVMPSGDYVVAIVLDQRGRVYGIRDHCADPVGHAGLVYVLSPPPSFDLLETVSVGACPVGAAAVLAQ